MTLKLWWYLLGLYHRPGEKQKWINAFKARSAPFTFHQPPTKNEVEEEAAALTKDIQKTNEKIFRKWCPPYPKASLWWTVVCSLATQRLQEARITEIRGIAQVRLKDTVWTAKRKWADDYIKNDQVWKVTTWKHGRKTSKVPSLKGTQGIMHTHEEITDLLSQCFFTKDLPVVEQNFIDNPPPRPTWTMPPINADLIEMQLNKANNCSAPGQSEHTWLVLKWAWKADPVSTI